MNRRTLIAFATGMLLIAAVSSEIYACGTDPAMPMMDDPMEIVASGSCGGEGDPPREDRGAFAGPTSSTSDSIAKNLYRDRAGIGRRIYGGQNKSPRIRQVAQ